MAGLLAGGVIVGIDPHASAEQTTFVVQHAGVTAVIADGRPHIDKLPPAIRDRLRFILLTEDMAGSADGATSAAWESGRSPGAPDLPALAGDNPATIIYTAGTTGAPRGIEYTHAQVMVGVRSLVELFPELSEGDATLCWLPMAHLYQRMMNLVALADGMVTYFIEDPREVAACLREVEPAFFSAVPRFFEKLHDAIRDGLPRAGWRKRLAEAALSAGADYSACRRAGRAPPAGLRLCHALLDWLVLRQARRAFGRKVKVLVTGSAPIATPLLEFFHSLSLLVYEGYALSENTVPLAANTRGGWRFGSVGKPLPQNEVCFAEDGEILVRGPGVFHGYFGERGAPDCFTAEGFYRTGDLGRLDEDGFLYLTGRKAEIIKTSTGRRIAPAHVERAYGQSPYLDQVVVFGNGRKHLVALVTLNPATVGGAVTRAGLPLHAGPELAALPFVRELVAREMEARGAPLAPHERARAFAILPAPLSVAEGELTPTLKLRRAAIAARHAALIKRLYDEERPDALAPGAPPAAREVGR
jgi:long-chain acyl-CoA synthetase